MHNAHIGVHSVGVQEVGVHSVGVQEVGVHSAGVHCVSVLSKDVSAGEVQRTCFSSRVKLIFDAL